jgi:hypothetical protein
MNDEYSLVDENCRDIGAKTVVAASCDAIGNDFMKALVVWKGSEPRGNTEDISAIGDPP